MANISNEIHMTKRKTAITITFGDCAENHKGMQIIGKFADCGFTTEELISTKEMFEREGWSIEETKLYFESDIKVTAEKR